MDVIVTAGATRNPIDAMRYITARSSGSTGIAVARALVAAGRSVRLLGSAEALLRAPDLDGEEYGSTRDLMTRVERLVREWPHAALVHAAAVGDYEVASPSTGKTSSGKSEWTLTLTPTPKIADHVRGWGQVGPYVTFKAAAPETAAADLAGIATAQRSRTGCDLVFANVLGRLDTDVLLVGEGIRTFDRRGPAVDALVDWIHERLPLAPLRGSMG